MRRIQRALVGCSEIMLFPLVILVFLIWHMHEQKYLKRAMTQEEK